MNLPTSLNKWVISNKFIKHTPFWWWYRLISHDRFRLGDYHIYPEFWHSLNGGWEHMEYVYKFEEFWGKGSYPPERIMVSEEAYDELLRRIHSPPDPVKIERLKEILNRKVPWDD